MKFNIELVELVTKKTVVQIEADTEEEAEILAKEAPFHDRSNQISSREVDRYSVMVWNSVAERKKLRDFMDKYSRDKGDE